MTVALDFAWQTPDFLLPSQGVRGAGTGVARSGCTADTMNVRASVVRGATMLQHAASIAVIIEKSSDDGDTWTTAHAFTFTGSGIQEAEIASTPDLLRVRWLPSAGRWASLQVEASPEAMSGGGGSSSVLYGPYTVNFDTPGVNDSQFYVPGSDTIPDGFWITDTLVEFTSDWGDGGAEGSFSMQAKLEIAPTENVQLGEWINKVDPYNGQQNIMNDAIQNDNSPAVKRVFRLDSARWAAEVSEPVTTAKFAMEIYSNRNPFTAGSIRIWAQGVQT